VLVQLREDTLGVEDVRVAPLEQPRARFVQPQPQHVVALPRRVIRLTQCKLRLERGAVHLVDGATAHERAKDGLVGSERSTGARREDEDEVQPHI